MRHSWGTTEAWRCCGTSFVINLTGLWWSEQRHVSKCLVHYILNQWLHYNDVIMGGMASQITSLTIVNSTVYSGADQRKHQSSASLAFVPGIHRGPVNSSHKWLVTRKVFPFDDVITIYRSVPGWTIDSPCDARCRRWWSIFGFIVLNGS